MVLGYLSGEQYYRIARKIGRDYDRVADGYVHHMEDYTHRQIKIRQYFCVCMCVSGLSK